MKDNGSENTNGKGEEVEETDEILEDELCTVLDDAGREEMEELVGLKVVGLDVWEDSLGDDEDEGPVAASERTFFDCDLLFDDGLALELYAASVYPDPEDEPLKGMDAISAAMDRLAEENLELLDFDEADEEGGLALAFGHGEKTELVIASGAWLVSEWEEDTAEDEPAEA